MSQDEGILIKRTLSKKAETEIFQFIAANCHPSFRPILTIVQNFWTEEVKAMLNEDAETKLVRRLQSGNSTNLIRSIFTPILEDPSTTIEKKSRLEFIRLLDEVLDSAKPALADALQSIHEKDYKHSDISDLVRKTITTTLLKTQTSALTQIQQSSRASFTVDEIRDIIRYAIKESSNKHECETFWWELDTAAYELQNKIIPTARHIKKSYFINSPAIEGDKLYEHLVLTATSQTKKDMGRAVEIFSKLGGMEQSSLEMITWCAKRILTAQYKDEVGTDNINSSTQRMVFDYIEQTLSHSKTWKAISGEIKSAREEIKTHLHPSRLHALQKFCSVCLNNKVDIDHTPSLSPSSDYYILATYFLRRSIGLETKTFTKDLREAFSLIQSERET